MTKLSLFPNVQRPSQDNACFERSVRPLCIGPWHNGEFVWVGSELSELAAWPVVTNVESAIHWLTTTDAMPELLLLGQAQPGDYQQAEIDRLQRIAPLARIVLIAGTWCEGEVRNLGPLAGVVRLYWHEFPSWWRAANAKAQEGLCPLWSRPLDRWPAGRCDFRATTQKVSSGTVAIATDDLAVYQTWADSLAAIGQATRWRRSFSTDNFPPDVVGGIWEGGQLCERELVNLRHFCRAVQTVEGRVVVLLDFPRIEHFPLVEAMGAEALFSKPYVVDEVLAALR